MQPEFLVLCAQAALYRQHYGMAVRLYRIAMHNRRGAPYNVIGESWWTTLPPSASAKNLIGSSNQASYGPELTSRHKLRHDIDQLDYLIHARLLPPSFTTTVSAMTDVLNHIVVATNETFHDAPNERGGVIKVRASKGGGYVILQQPQIDYIGPAFAKVAYMNPGRSMQPYRAVRHLPRLEVNALESAYMTNDVLYFDNLLSDKALDRMRQYCLESVAWHQQKSLGYLGSQLDDGFASPLLFQIAEELRQALPHIFWNHQLRHAWAYKYDSVLQEGIDAHADANPLEP